MAEELWEDYERSGGTRTREQFDEDQMIKACESYLTVELKLGADVTERQLAEAQWSHLLKATLDATLVHLKKGEDFNIDAHNQTLEHQSCANMVAAAIDMLQAQGDLMLQEIPSQQLLMSAAYTNWLPIADKECVNFLECEHHLFSDSVLKLGKKGEAKWEGYYEEALAWM